MILPDIRKIDVQGKKVFLRCDLDVTLQNPETRIRKPEIADKNDLRLVSSLATIKYFLENGATVILGGHLGRPKGQVVAELSLEPVAEWYKNQFKIQNAKGKITIQNLKLRTGGFGGWEITENLFLLENLRFYPGEEANDPEFSKKLASLAEVFINDAFAMCHRKAASTVGISKLLPHFAGIQLQEEVKNLGLVLENPQRPLVVIIGGAKIETKLPLVSKMNHFADEILVGGLIVQEMSAMMIEKGKAEIIMADSNPDKTDITKESVAKFLKVIQKAKMIVWNGPVGKIDQKSLRPELRARAKIKNQKLTPRDSEWGTWKITQEIIKSSAFRIAGGGDTVEYLSRENLLDKFDFVSTGGGAMLSFLSSEKLPGIEALLNQ